MADGSPSLIPFLGAMTASQDTELSQLSSPDEGPMAPYPKIEDMETQDLYPPQSYYSRPPSRTVHVDFTGWTQRHLQVTEGGPGGALAYTVKITTREPQLQMFTLIEPNVPLATATFNPSGSTIQISIHRHKFPIDVRARLKKEGKFESPTLQNAPLTWKSRSMKMVDFELRDGNGIPLAHFNPHPSWSRRKAGRLELFGPSVSTGQLMEEIMVTAFALVHSAILQLEAVAEAG
ncbi:hypothetical protein BJX70DRAFT_406533 [Aspergillus crustosus]